MILYSIVPPEQVFPSPPPEYAVRRVHNSYIQGIEQGGEFTVSRLISTDPAMYLDPRYRPGSVLKRPGG